MVVPYQYSTSNRNGDAVGIYAVRLFLINILHQTATSRSFLFRAAKLFLISILHQTATATLACRPSPCCSLSVFYIKPQHNVPSVRTRLGCSLSVFYIKPQRGARQPDDPLRCSLSVFYIKPQRRRRRLSSASRLFLISILHQTATYTILFSGVFSLFLISILHQTATRKFSKTTSTGCSLSIFYIKPQREVIATFPSTVVPYQYSTSNRNHDGCHTWMFRLFLINILHQTATLESVRIPGNMLFLINILHQTATKRQPLSWT